MFQSGAHFLWRNIPGVAKIEAADCGAGLYHNGWVLEGEFATQQMYMMWGPGGFSFSRVVSNMFGKTMMMIANDQSFCWIHHSNSSDMFRISGNIHFLSSGRTCWCCMCSVPSPSFTFWLVGFWFFVYLKCPVSNWLPSNSRQNVKKTAENLRFSWRMQSTGENFRNKNVLGPQVRSPLNLIEFQWNPQ